MISEIEKKYANCFGTSSGAAVLSHLRKITIDRTFGPNSTDNELRWAESQRALFRYIETMISRGRGDKS